MEDTSPSKPRHTVLLQPLWPHNSALSTSVNEKEIKQLVYLKKNTIYPGESVSGYIHIDCTKGVRLVVNVHIAEAEYLYEWGIGKKETFILEK